MYSKKRKNLMFIVLMIAVLIISASTQAESVDPRTVPPHTVTIFLNPNGGSVNPTSVTRTSGTRVGTLPIPTRANREFIDWFRGTAIGSERITSDTITPTVSFIATARWADAQRHLSPWARPARTGTTIIYIPSFSDVNTTWRSPMIAGMTTWNVSSTRVTFRRNDSNSGNSTIAVLSSSGTYLGQITRWRVSGTNILSRYNMRINTRTITNHANNNNFSLSNVIQSVFAHELGHVLGLRDGSGIHLGGFCCGSLMNHARNRNNIRAPQPFDVTSVNFIYN